MSNQALACTWRDEISEKHRECLEADHELKRALTAKLEKTRAVGVCLDAARSELKSNEFNELLKQLPMSVESVRSYLVFMRRHPEPINDVKLGLRAAVESAIATGALPAPSGHGPQSLHVPNFFSVASRTIQQLAAEWTKFLRAKPLATWEPEVAHQFLLSLKPILSIHKQVLQFLANVSRE